MAIQIKSEIGKLNKVLLHRPGKELEHLVPGDLERQMESQYWRWQVQNSQEDVEAHVV